MKTSAAFAILVGFTAGCAVSRVPPRPVPTDTLPRSRDASFTSVAEASLRRYLGPSRYLRLSRGEIRSDGSYDYAAFVGEWAIEGGFEGVYHAGVIFVKRRADADWSAARIFLDPRPYSSPFVGPIQFLEEKGSEFGKPKPYPTEKGPDLLVIPGTHP